MNNWFLHILLCGLINLPGTSVVEFQEDGMLEVVLTQEALDKIKAEGGFLCVGHGYYVDRVSVK